MNNRLFPRMAFCLTLMTSFLFIPSQNVYADGLTQDSEYWKWWYVENTTDAITEGDGASADNLTDTYNGSTVGQYVYDQTGLTADDVKDYVQQQYDNATGYVEHTAEWYSSAIDDIWNSSIDVGTKAKYQAEKALRETVDTAGNTVVNVSSSDYWSNVYNDIFNSGSYNDVYADVTDGSYSVGYNGQNINFTFAGVGDYNYYMNSPTPKPAPSNMFVSAPALFEQFVERTGSKNFAVGQMTVNGETYYFLIGSNNNYYYPYSDFNVSAEDQTRVHITVKYDNIFYKDATFVFNGPIDGVGAGGTPVLQPKQVGFVTHDGIKYPVYTDTSLNPFKINDTGTVTWLDGSGDEPIYIEPSQLTDDGSLDILEWLDQDNLTQNPYNPFGKPWNTQDDGSILGGLFSGLVEDISSLFNWIKKQIETLLDKIIKFLKDIANIIVDALKSFWNLLIGDIEGYSELFDTDVDDNFDMISDLYDLLLECMGVDT